ncbi:MULTISPECIES: hypothetical protein [Streptomyces]|uniref:Uncharacterized protein n=1 Tax=Streptomyces pseudovenezuelae TaxID=67350 RepID=A0A117PPI8_9ACTN|nr:MULTISPECIES: hypothetical protein [Streptomyces]KUM84648.1 hypothetical protein AQI94_29175 [Streptomyces pseudovenezuelae]
MAATTHTHVRIAARPRSDRDGVTGERSPRDTVRPGERDRPTDPRVWNWAESVTLSGYGPSAFSFL